MRVPDRPRRSFLVDVLVYVAGAWAAASAAGSCKTPQAAEKYGGPPVSGDPDDNGPVATKYGGPMMPAQQPDANPPAVAPVSDGGAKRSR